MTARELSLIARPGQPKPGVQPLGILGEALESEFDISEKDEGKFAKAIDSLPQLLHGRDCSSWPIGGAAVHQVLEKACVTRS
jgi:hypothetical protein